mmetsp:Transcript_4017/g.4453  ORF Transcript_4017/g.4453 Transcript_4017/m.4453 type:complete len:245 (+) Transcript_4017:158-892(+)
MFFRILIASLLYRMASAQTSSGCFSNNYKDCNHPAAAQSCNVIWLSSGAQNNCLALWATCDVNADACCAPASCFSDGINAQCVPPPDTEAPVSAPTPPSPGCFSNNYKHCNHPAAADSCTVIWLPQGAQNNCIALWGECTSNDACCEPAVCSGDGNYSQCVPPPDETPSPSYTPSYTPSSTPTRNCIVCDDVETPWMASNGKDCTTSSLINTKCNKNDNWTAKKFCRLSCFNAGNGYEGDVCCN